MRRSLVILFFAFLNFFGVHEISALGLGANVSSVDLALKAGHSQAVKISVFNVSKEAGIFKVFPDELENWISIKPDNFRLEAGENKEVEIVVFGRERGVRKTNISIMALPLDRQSLSVGPGLKIPTTLNIRDEKLGLLAFVSDALNAASLFFLLSLILLFLLARFLFFKYRKQSN